MTNGQVASIACSLESIRLGHHLRRDTVGRENHVAADRHVFETLDEDRALLLQVLDDHAVVDDLVADVHGRPELVERLEDDLDRALDAGAKTAGTT